MPKVNKDDSLRKDCDMTSEDDTIFQPQNDEDKKFASILDEAQEDDLKEIADILGIMYQNDCSAEPLTAYPVEQFPNVVNFTDIIERIENNDPELKVLNLNNVHHLDKSQWLRIFKALEDKNDVVEEINAANCQLKDHLVPSIAQALSSNVSLKRLTLDSNQFTGQSLIQILKCLTSNCCLQELRFSNQVIQQGTF